ncbi:MAG: hypothetical protein WBO09_20210 [Methylocystis silviterrae]|uniref:hypothetical protein n=1 Tax=Methylocystis silviterrae TaxID=2743612 RepID=UPI003C71442C
MSKTRNNHYVPQWYQEGFCEPGRSSLAYVDMTPDRKVLPDGRVITQNGVWNDTPTSRAFFHKDLYSTFFGTSVNDEIERYLFGDIDGRGSKAVRAFLAPTFANGTSTSKRFSSTSISKKSARPRGWTG